MRRRDPSSKLCFTKDRDRFADNQIKAGKDRAQDWTPVIISDISTADAEAVFAVAHAESWRSRSNRIIADQVFLRTHSRVIRKAEPSHTITRIALCCGAKVT